MSDEQRLNLLVVDADATVREACRDVAAAQGLATRLVDAADAARHAMCTADVHLVLMDMRLPFGGMELLREMRELRPDAVLIIASLTTSIQFAVEAMRFGAYDFVSKPFHLEELRLALTRAAQQWRSGHEARRVRDRMTLEREYLNLAGDSPEMEKLYRIIGKAASSASPVLITGERGTGKELVARTIHAASPQAKRPFLVVDCEAIASTRMEAEIFGRLDGAAVQPGLLAAADGGTVLFDEIGELPLELQGKLVRAMQDSQVRPVGGSATMPVEMRVLATTRRDLDHASQNGVFRRDLYFRLNVVSVKVPPLRQRKQDIPLLAAHFLKRSPRRTTRFELTDTVIETLMNYDWPGNVRELETCIERASETTPGAFISQFQILTGVRLARELALASAANQSADMNKEDLGILPLAVIEKRAILEALSRLGGDRLEAAKHLGIGKTTLYRKLKEYEASGELVIA